MYHIWFWFFRLVTFRPHFIVMTPDENGDPIPQLYRRWLIPRNPWFNIYLHHFAADDMGGALHDHPWWSWSVLLKGSLIEEKPLNVNAPAGTTIRWRIPRWRPIFRNAEDAHRLMIDSPGGAWTLFITGPNVRGWGFWCPKGWVPWREYVDRGQGRHIPRGCGEIDT